MSRVEFTRFFKTIIFILLVFLLVFYSYFCLKSARILLVFSKKWARMKNLPHCNPCLSFNFLWLSYYRLFCFRSHSCKSPLFSPPFQWTMQTLLRQQTSLPRSAATQRWVVWYFNPCISSFIVWFSCIINCFRSPSRLFFPPLLWLPLTLPSQQRSLQRHVAAQRWTVTQVKH